MAKTTLLVVVVALLCSFGCEPSEPDPVPVDGGVQHPVRDAGAPPADAAMSGGGDSGAADAGNSDDSDR